MKKKCVIAFEEIVSMENLCAAWEEFIPSKRKKKDVRVFALHLMDELTELHRDLLSGSYRHGPYEHFKISDPKPRDIHKATVGDRVLHHAIHRKLYPFFASLFIADSFSCQVGKGLHRALRRFEVFGRKVSQNNTDTCWVLKCDIRKFFANVDHDVLRSLLIERIKDQRVLGLLENVINSFPVKEGQGIPLGNLTSQLFANVYLHELDQYVKKIIRVESYVRYADDFVFLSQDRDLLVGLLDPLKSFLLQRLRLEMHPDKVILKTLASGVDFLGWTHFPHHRVLRTKTKQRMVKRLGQGVTEKAVASYLGLLSHGNAYELREGILSDGWFWFG